MDDSEVEKAIATLREAIRARKFAQLMAEQIVDQLGNAGIEVEHHPTHTAWRRVGPAQGKGDAP